MEIDTLDTMVSGPLHTAVPGEATSGEPGLGGASGPGGVCKDAAHDRGIPSNQWANIAAAPGDAEPYRRTRIALAWLLGLPGAPLVYYGDEYGQYGGADPNNRLM